MRGEVGLARGGQRVDPGVAATAWNVSPRMRSASLAVVDQQRQPALRGQPGGDPRPAPRGPGQLQHVPSARSPARPATACGNGVARARARSGRRRRRRPRPGARASGRRRTNWRIGRASRNSLATSEQGAVAGTPASSSCQRTGRPARGPRPAARARPGWSRPGARRPHPGTPAPRGRAEGVGHQRAAAGAELDQADRGGRPRSSQCWPAPGRSARRTAG